MRTLSATLLAAQKSSNRKPVIGITSSYSGEDDIVIAEDRIVDVKYDPQSPYYQKATILLNNRDNYFDDIDLKAWQAVIATGFVTSEGDETSNQPKLWVMGQTFNDDPHQPPICKLDCIGIPNRMNMDKADADYEPDDDDTLTCKDLLDAIAGDTSRGITFMSAFNQCQAYSITYDSEDDVIDSHQPKSRFRVYVGDTRLAKFREVLEKTKCQMRAEDDGKIHIFVPSTTGQGVAGTETLRPNATGDEANLTPIPGTGEDNFEDVDEETTDNFTTYVNSGDTWARDFYNIENSSGEGVINSITVYARCQSNNNPEQTTVKVCIKSGTDDGAPDTADEGDEQTTANGGAWGNFTEEWATNPATSAAWTWDEIDKLQIGVSLREPIVGTGITRCTQIWVVVDYGADLDYEYALTTGSHSFFSKAYRQALVIPNKITVKSFDDDDDSYSGSATSAASYALMAVEETIRMTLASNDEADDIASALIARAELWSEAGSIEVPMNVGAEVFDFIQVTSSRADDERTGTTGQLSWHYQAGKGFTMRISFGNWATVEGILERLGTSATELQRYIPRLMVKSLYAEKITAGQLDVDTLSAVAADMGLLTAGEIRVGTGTVGSDFTGFRIFDTYIAGYLSDVLQAYFSAADGALYAGGGNVAINADGITVTGQDLRLKYSSSIVGYVYGIDGGVAILGDTGVYIYTTSGGGVSIGAGSGPTTPTSNDMYIEADDEMHLRGDRVTIGSGTADPAGAVDNITIYAQNDVTLYADDKIILNPTTESEIYKLMVDHDERASYALDTVYENTGDSPVMVVITVHLDDGDWATLQIGDANPPTIDVSHARNDSGGDDMEMSVFAIVNLGQFYKLKTIAGSPTILEWHEWGLGTSGVTGAA